MEGSFASRRMTKNLEVFRFAEKPGSVRVRDMTTEHCHPERNLSRALRETNGVEGSLHCLRW